MKLSGYVPDSPQEHILKLSLAIDNSDLDMTEILFGNKLCLVTTDHNYTIISLGLSIGRNLKLGLGWAYVEFRFRFG